MAKLFLSSAGLKPETKDDFLKLLGKPPADSLVAFIATAADPEPDKSFIQWSIDQIKEAGLKIIEIDLKGEMADTLYEKLSPADVIWVNGGNTFYLLDQIRKSGFDKIIVKLLEEGRIYFGVSAGSIVAGLSIETSGWKPEGDENLAGLTDYTAMKLAPFDIFVHYKERHKELIKEAADIAKNPLFVLSDQQAVIVDGEKIKVVGAGEIIKFN